MNTQLCDYLFHSRFSFHTLWNWIVQLIIGFFFYIGYECVSGCNMTLIKWIIHMLKISLFLHPSCSQCISSFYQNSVHLYECSWYDLIKVKPLFNFPNLWDKMIIIWPSNRCLTISVATFHKSGQGWQRQSCFGLVRHYFQLETQGRSIQKSNLIILYRNIIGNTEVYIS